MLFLTNHLWLCGFFLVGVTTLIAMAGPIIVRRRVSLENLSNNNEVAGSKFAVVGVLYAVMQAFAVIVVWEKFNDAEGRRTGSRRSDDDLSLIGGRPSGAGRGDTRSGGRLS
jgi:hypothetical protein